jgi:hypothetical protein
MKCLNKSNKEIAKMIDVFGEVQASKLLDNFSENTIPSFNEVSSFYNSSPEVGFTLKAIDILSSDKAKQTFDKGQKNNWDLDRILTELQIPKEQKQLILDNVNNLTPIFNDIKSGNDIKPGVEELFESNPKLANAVYEAAGIKQDNTLESNLKTFFSNFGFQFKEGESSTDLLNKIIYTSNKDSSVFIDNSVKALSQLLLANTNIDFHKLENLIEDTPEFKKLLNNSSDYLKTTHKFLKEGNRIPMEEWVSYIKEYNKIKNEVLEKYLKESLLENKNSTELHKLINDFLKWFRDLFTNAKNLKEVTDSLIQQVLMNQKEVVINSKDLQNKEKVTLAKALEETTHGKDIIKTFGEFGLILTGSVSAAEQGSVFRKTGKLLHDIDWVVPKGFDKDFNDKLKDTFPGTTLVREFDSPSYYTQTYIVPPKGYTISNLTFFKPETYGERKYIASYDVLDKNGNIVSNYRRYYDIKKSGKVVENREVYNEGLKNVDKNLEAVSVDFFQNKEALKYKPYTVNVEGVNLQLSNWLSSFTEKLKYGRAKDLLDYANFIPNDLIPQTSQITPQQKQQAQQLYSEYLDTIFTDSKVKDIVYHGANEPIEGEKFTKREGATGRGIWFSGSRKYAQIQMDRAQPSESLIGRKLRGAPTMYQVVLNIKNPKNFYNSSGALLVQTPSKFEEQYDRKNNDAALFHHPNSKKPATADSADQVVVFLILEPEQIHILSSKADIQGFKDYMAFQNSEFAGDFLNISNNKKDYSYINNIKELKVGDYIQEKNSIAKIVNISKDSFDFVLIDNLTDIEKNNYNYYKDLFESGNHKIKKASKSAINKFDKAKKIIDAIYNNNKNVVSKNKASERFIKNFIGVQYTENKNLTKYLESTDNINVIDLLSIIQETDNHFGDLAKTIKQIIENNNYEIFITNKEPKENIAGDYIDGKINMYIPINSSDYTRVVLHELLHAISDNNLFQQKIDKLYNYVTKFFKNNNIDYGFTNNREFLAEIYTNQVFQELMAQLEYTEDSSKKLSVLDKFLELLASFFEIKNNSVLKEAFVVLEDMLKYNNLNSSKSGDLLWNRNNLIGTKQDVEGFKEFVKTPQQFNLREQLALELASNYSYTIEINTAKNIAANLELADEKDYFNFNGLTYQISDNKFKKNAEIITEKEYNDAYNKALKNKPNSQYYSNLTVPGGTNYTENEIATPAITPSIKGHAAFSTDSGIGWFRSDDKTKEGTGRIDEWDDDKNQRVVQNFIGGEATKTRRILEVQSDLFQKGRDKERIAELKEYNEKTIVSDIDKLNKQNQFLQLLNKDNNWVTFFVKSIIQDSAKKGYEKVLFPKLDTIIQIESAGKFKTYEEAEKHYKNEKWYEEDTKLRKVLDAALNKPKEEQNLEHILRLKEQIAANQPKLLNTAKFYENDITNILKKQGYSPKLITDEYGNTWNEIVINEKANALILLDKSPLNKNENVNSLISTGRTSFSTKEALTIIKNDSKSEPMRILAEHLMSNIVNEVPIEILDHGDLQEIMSSSGNYDFEVNGFFDHDLKKIFISNTSKDSTVLHEIIHAFTVAKLRTPTIPGVQDLKNIYEHIKIVHSELKSMYPMSNLDEFMTGIFTNAEFMRKLQTLPSRGTGKLTLWDNLITALSKLFGFSKDQKNLLTEAMDIGTRILSDKSKAAPVKEKSSIFASAMSKLEMMDDKMEAYRQQEITKKKMNKAKKTQKAVNEVSKGSPKNTIEAAKKYAIQEFDRIFPQYKYMSLEEKKQLMDWTFEGDLNLNCKV